MTEARRLALAAAVTLFAIATAARAEISLKPGYRPASRAMRPCGRLDS
jgi:hypothetical protein